MALSGAGGHGKVVADAALSLGRDEIVGFLDDDPELIGRSIMGLPVLGSVARWREFAIDALIPTIGANRARRDVMLRARSTGATVIAVVHPRAIVSTWARLGSGTAVLAGAVVNAGASIGDDVILNTGAIVEHDCVVGSYAHLAPGCCLAGDVRIGEGAFLGMGSRVLPGVSIGSWCVIGAGAVVTKDIEDHTTMAGVPARRLR